jgi:hypothetical protein
MTASAVILQSSMGSGVFFDSSACRPKEIERGVDKLSEGATLELVVPYPYVVLHSGIAVLISI